MSHWQNVLSLYFGTLGHAYFAVNTVNHAPESGRYGHAERNWALKGGSVGWNPTFDLTLPGG